MVAYSNPNPDPDPNPNLLRSAPAKAEWEAQQAAKQRSAYVEDGRGYGEVEMAEKPVRLVTGT